MIANNVIPKQASKSALLNILLDLLAAFTMESMRSDPFTMALFIHVFEGAVAFQMHQNAQIRK